MPRCYMVKKDLSPLGGIPPCSPTEASVAPPCYTPHDHHSLAGPRSAQYAEPLRHVGTQYEEPRTGDFAEKGGANGASTSPRGAASRHEPERSTIYSPPPEPDDQHVDLHCHEESIDDTWDEAPASLTKIHPSEYDPCQTDYSDPRHAAEPRSGDYAEPRTVRYIERDLSNTEPRAAEYAEPRTKNFSGHDDSHSSEYAELHKYSAEEGSKAVEYAELQSTRAAAAVSQRSAADTEAAHELLSLAAGVPPLPPAAMLTMLGAPDPVVPLYTYALQPTSIYIIADEPANHNLYATAVQTLAPLQQVDYNAQPQVSTYIAYQDPVGATPIYQPLYSGGTSEAPAEVASMSVPVSVIEAAPASEAEPMSPPATTPGPVPTPLSVQVPVIEPVPHSQAPQETYDTDSDDNSALCIDIKKNKFNCNECGKRYATSSNLSRHKQTHRSLDSQAAKRCSECGKAYVSMPALAMHVLTHRMGYVCGVCGKQFSRPWLLRGHLRSHTGEKPYNCPSCSKSFADRSNLRAHLQTHAPEKRWECTRCNKTFALKSYLNKHQEAACTQDDQVAQ